MIDYKSSNEHKHGLDALLAALLIANAECGHNFLGAFIRVGELVDVNNINLVDDVLILELWNWSERFDHDVGDGLTGTLPVVLGDILGVFGNILGDLDEVVSDIASNSLGEFDWVLEDSGPFFNSGDVVFDSHAITGISWDFFENFTNGFDSSEDSLKIFLLEITDGDLDFTSNIFVVLQAHLDFIEFVVVDEGVGESGDEFNSIFLWNWWNDWPVRVEWVPSLHLSTFFHGRNISEIVEVEVVNGVLWGWVDLEVWVMVNHDESGLGDLSLHFDF